MLALLFGGASLATAVEKADCSKVGLTIQSEVKAAPSSILMIVEKAVRADSSCACEIVKAAIIASEAESDLVASIVEVVAIASPEQMRIAAQCAVAVAPDALADVQAVLAKYDPATGDGESSGKEVAEKGGMDEKPAGANPLDFPTNGQEVAVGPSPGGAGGFSYLPTYFPYRPTYVGTNPASNNDLGN